MDLIGVVTLIACNLWFTALQVALPTEPMLIGPSLDVSPLYTGVAVFVLSLIPFVVMAGALRPFVIDEERVSGNSVMRYRVR